jgi:tryptophan synthase alpha chain
MLRLLPSNSPSKGRIASRFRKTQTRGEGALIAYLTGGDPDPKTFLSNASTVVGSGADILEVGIPFSDPVADGPVIQASSQRALSKGITPRKVLELVRKLSKSEDTPVALLTYYNPVMAMGVERFMEATEGSGVDGVVIPDLPFEESDWFCEIARHYGVDTIFLAAPNTSLSRLEEIIARSRGFLYLVSLFGVTGPRKTLSPLALGAVRRVKSLAKGRIPIAAGFGVSQPDHVASLVRAGADGAIVGSALVDIVGKHLDHKEGVSEILRDTVSCLKNATRRIPS